MIDTLPEAEAILRVAIQRRAPIQRLRDALQLSDALRDVALAAMRRRFPDEPVVALVSRLTGEPPESRVRMGPRAGS